MGQESLPSTSHRLQKEKMVVTYRQTLEKTLKGTILKYITVIKGLISTSFKIAQAGNSNNRNLSSKQKQSFGTASSEKAILEYSLISMTESRGEKLKLKIMKK